MELSRIILVLFVALYTVFEINCFPNQLNSEDAEQLTIHINSPFKSPKSPKNNHIYEHKISFTNSRVCQIRLDFKVFEIAPPTFNENKNYVECINDYFSVEPITENNIPRLCGSENHQHIYVHRRMSRTFYGSIHLYMSLGNVRHYPPVWDIQITQIECPKYMSEPQLPQIGMSNDNMLPYKNGELMAPSARCLQYFNEDTARVQSMGYGNHIYYSFDYMICFSTDCNSLKLTVDDFVVDKDETVGDDEPCGDSLVYIPNGKVDDKDRTEFCGKVKTGTIIEARQEFSPLIEFKSIKNADQLTGFSMLHQCL